MYTELQVTSPTSWVATAESWPPGGRWQRVLTVNTLSLITLTVTSLAMMMMTRKTWLSHLLPAENINLLLPADNNLLLPADNNLLLPADSSLLLPLDNALLVDSALPVVDARDVEDDREGDRGSWSRTPSRSSNVSCRTSKAENKQHQIKHNY